MLALFGRFCYNMTFQLCENYSINNILPAAAEKNEKLCHFIKDNSVKEINRERLSSMDRFFAEIIVKTKAVYPTLANK